MRYGIHVGEKNNVYYTQNPSQVGGLVSSIGESFSGWVEIYWGFFMGLYKWLIGLSRNLPHHPSI